MLRVAKPSLILLSGTVLESFFDSLQGRRSCNGYNPLEFHSCACAISSQLRSDNTENGLHWTILNSFRIEPTVLRGRHAQASNRSRRSQELAIRQSQLVILRVKKRARNLLGMSDNTTCCKLPAGSRNHAAAFANAQLRHCTTGDIP